ncbi:hypothetical protein GCM10027346_02880 [Hymenobacter seoulensis]
MYAVKAAAADRELAMVREKLGAESAEYKKLAAEKISAEAAYVTKKKASHEDLTGFKKKLGEIEKFLTSDSARVLEESLGKQTLLYKAFKVARKAEAIASIGIALQEEIQAHWVKAATMGPVIGPIYGIGMSGLSFVRRGIAAAKVAGFCEGGATGVAAPAQGGVMAGFSVGSNGKLLDAQGFPIAGVVHENEYVIPEWMRADPQVVQVEQFLEQKRLQGYRAGGDTNDPPVRPAALASGGEAVEQLTNVLDRLDSRLQNMGTNLKVIQHTGELIDDIDYIKKVLQAAEIK